MKREALDRTANRPKPVQRIELSDKHFTLKTAAFIGALVILAGVLIYSVLTLLRVENGWTAIEADSGAGLGAGAEFVFNYELGADGESPAIARKALTMLYTTASVRAYQVLDARQTHMGIQNLWQVNSHPNQEVRVEPELYRALEKMESAGRWLYLGPIWESYQSLFNSASDAEAAAFDPFLDEETRAWVAEAAAYAMNPADISLRFLGNDTVCLTVSDRYAAFCRDSETTAYLDFSWMRNAFAADCIAEALIEKGYTHGTLSSLDGFTRCLDERNTLYAQNLYELQDGRGVPVGRLEYTGPMTLVTLRAFPIDPAHETHYYVYGIGDIRTAAIDPQDGLCKAAFPFLCALSRHQGCADVLLSLLPAYIADQPDETALEAIQNDDLGIVRVENGTIVTNTSLARFSPAE
ncbi:MAG: hypothetical protein IJ189_09730 [Clostridia bacterium]|nr:hypothetical protein [Clostridia bacterium]